MKVLYDSSALIALYLEAHPDYETSDLTYRTLEQSDAEFYITAHSIAEFYSTVTKGKRYLNLTPVEAKIILKDEILSASFSTVPLDETDYLDTIEHLSTENLTGGIIYDGIIVQASNKINAEYVVTLDERDFKVLGGLTSADIINPALQ